MKFAATILALALATTHGLLDEGDHNVQKKDASKGLRGSKVNSSLERAAVGRKLDFYISPPVPAPTPSDPILPEFCCDGTLGTPEQCREIELSGKCDPTPVPVPEPTRTPTTAPTSSEPTVEPTVSPTPQPTKKPTCPPKKVDVCIAVDESGSICSAVPGQPKLCEDGECTATECKAEPPSDECDYSPALTLPRRANCGKFNGVTKDFATEFINELELQLNGGDELRVSVVEYGTLAKETTGLTDATTAKDKVNGIEYSGGYTNLEQAIELCKATLEGQGADESAIAIIGDGTPTVRGTVNVPSTYVKECPADIDDPKAANCKAAAEVAATVKDPEGLNIDIATVFLESVYEPQPGIEFFKKEIASEGLDFLPPNFISAEGLAEAILKEVACSSD